jgi:putative oxidoreductase
MRIDAEVDDQISARQSRLRVTHHHLTQYVTRNRAFITFQFKYLNHPFKLKGERNVFTFRSSLVKPLKTQADLGLLVLRGSALLLLLLFGWGKLVSLFLLISGRQAWSSWGLAADIAKVGFSASVPLAVFVVLCESVGTLFIALGLFTRVSAALAALSMAGALYFSLRMGERWYLAALYLLLFVALALTGPGKFSIDRVLKLWPKRGAS